MMRRREVIAAFGWTLFLTGHSTAVAQQSPSKRAGVVDQKLVGVLYRGGGYSTQLDSFRDELRRAGLREGAHLRIDIRELTGNFQTVQDAARALESSGADVLVAFGVSLAWAAQQSTSTIPIVFTTGRDPVALGLIQSVNKPGGRITGISSFSTDSTAKRLDILRELLPRLKRLVAFYDPANPAGQEAIEALREAAGRMSVELVERQVRSAQEVRDSSDALSLSRADAFFLVNDALVESLDETIITKASVVGLPVMAQNLDWVAKGALVGYGADAREHGRAAARYVARILNGARPSELPVEVNERHSLGINLKTAKALGITIPPTLLARADEVIE
jgi:putative tryptophan/tyrosine transport system substrate-binding protein